jgi:hypothetical protein
MPEDRHSSELPRCSFCKKDSNQVRRLVAGPGVYICDECIAVCADIIADATPLAEGPPDRTPQPRWSGGDAAVRCGLCGMPCLSDEVLLIEEKGVLCRPCVSDVEARSADENWARYSPKR